MRVSIDSEKLDLLANVISDKSGEPTTMTLAEMTDAVDNIQTGGSAPVLETKTATPSETAQVITPDSGYDGLAEVDIDAIPSDYVGSGITRRSSSSLTASGATVTAPAGYYASSATKTVASGTAGTPTATKGTVSNHSVSVTPSVTNTTGYITGSTKTGTAVTVSASELVSGTVNITASGNTDVTNYATASVASGTATPSATKGTVSNHSVTVTPSVTRTAGYVTAGSANGTAVTVSASELVSGSQTITENGTVDVTNLASVTINVSGGGGATKNIQVNSGAASVRTNGYTSTGISLTVAKTGKYNVSWTAWRSSSSGTMGTNLHKNSTTGTNQQTWTNTYGQHITLSNQSYTAGDVLTLYATAGSTSRYCWVSNLIIEEQ